MRFVAIILASLFTVSAGAADGAHEVYFDLATEKGKAWLSEKVGMEDKKLAAALADQNSELAIDLIKARNEVDKLHQELGKALLAQDGSVAALIAIPTLVVLNKFSRVGLEVNERFVGGV